MKEKIRDLFLKNFDQLIENEIHVFNLLNEKFLFLGPNLNLKLLVQFFNEKKFFFSFFVIRMKVFIIFV